MHCFLFSSCREMTSVGGGYSLAFYFSQLPRWCEIGALEALYLPKQTSKRFERSLDPLDFCAGYYTLAGWENNMIAYHFCNQLQSLSIPVSVFWFTKAVPPVSTSVGKKTFTVYCSENNGS